jgi:hypothetical protein
MQEFYYFYTRLDNLIGNELNSIDVLVDIDLDNLIGICYTVDHYMYFELRCDLAGEYRNSQLPFYPI